MNRIQQEALKNNWLVLQSPELDSDATTKPPSPSANTAKPVVGSIRVIRNRLIEEGYQVSEYMLRQMVKQSIIPAVYSGSKALISYASVINVLTRATG